MLETEYDGPVTEGTITVGGRTIRLARPADPDRLLDDPAVLDLNLRDDYMPYWAYLWPGAFLLAEAVGRAEWPGGTTALEIGCGLGLAGLVGMAAGLSVHFTDYDEAPLRFVRRSLSLNGFDERVGSTCRLDWRDLPPERYPLILGADVLYEKQLVPLVADVLATMLAPDGEAWVAGPYRVATEGLEAALAPRGLIATGEPITATNGSGRTVRGTWHRIRRRS